MEDIRTKFEAYSRIVGDHNILRIKRDKIELRYIPDEPRPGTADLGYILLGIPSEGVSFVISRNSIIRGIIYNMLSSKA